MSAPGVVASSGLHVQAFALTSLYSCIQGTPTTAGMPTELDTGDPIRAAAVSDAGAGTCFGPQREE